MSLHNLIYLVVGFLVLVTPLVGVVENVQEVLAQEQEQEQEQQNASSSNAATTSITQGQSNILLSFQHLQFSHGQL
jgi:glutamate racemase